MKILSIVLVSSALIGSAQAGICPHFSDATRAFDQGELQMNGHWYAQRPVRLDTANIKEWDGPISHPCGPDIQGDQCCTYTDSNGKLGYLYMKK